MGKNLFNSVKMTKPNKNTFDLSHEVKLSCNMGELIPIAAIDCVPGDSFRLGCQALIRMAPMVAPVMHQVNVTFHWYFVPNRLTWSGWEEWITNDPQDPQLASQFPVMSFQADEYGERSLADYMGLPYGTPLNGDQDPSADQVVSAIPFAAYQMIYNEYYRDQNLVDALYGQQGYLLEDGEQSAPIRAILHEKRIRAWEHDYYTSALPFAQKGSAVSLPLGEITYDSTVPIATGIEPIWRELLGDATATDGTLSQTTGAGGPYIRTSGEDSALGYDPKGSLVNTATTINDLRRAFRLQEYLEKNARGGTRYIEHILVHFGVKSSDARLNRPEYITGSKTGLVISEVLNTAGNADLELPQGNMAGHGVTVVNARKYGTYYCEEHGYIMGIMSILPRTAYQQGFPKHFLKHQNPTQYFYPSFANIGEQPILNKEIYGWLPAGTDEGDADGTFGYTPRYAEYKFIDNRVAGSFKSSLSYWHMGRIFEEKPSLNSDFISSSPTTRIFAVPGAAEHLYCQILNTIKATRPMPKFGTPSF